MKLFDSKQQTIINFIPKGKKATIYVCGITPYDSAHLGHIFTFMIYDLIYRYLIYEGYEVKMIRNITDVDEPIYKKADELKLNYKILVNDQIQRFNYVMDQLDFLKPYKEPRASQYIQEMFKATKKLLRSGYAYRLNGDIYFDTSKINNYGQSFNIPSNMLKKLAKIRGGNPGLKNKHHPLDFLLFKSMPKENEEVWNDKILGHGMVGWHIECSVMSAEILGLPFDLHGGGTDLIFPHHESEIAQTKSIYFEELARNWLHVAPLLLYGEKMSKSLGNLVYAEDLLKKYSGAVIKLALMEYNYQEGGEWVNQKLENALVLWNKLKKLYKNKAYDMDYIHILKETVFNRIGDNLSTADIIYELNIFTNKKMIGNAPDNLVFDQILEILGLKNFIY